MQETKLYIAYGSNLNINQMAHRCPTAKLIGQSYLKDYRLLFRGSRLGAVATIEESNSKGVPVLIWQLTAADEANLDRYEGFPSFYRKEYLKVQIDGAWHTAMVYIMNEGRTMGLPSQSYYNTILEGYRAAGFDSAVLDEAVRFSGGQDPESNA